MEPGWFGRHIPCSMRSIMSCVHTVKGDTKVGGVNHAEPFSSLREQKLYLVQSSSSIGHSSTEILIKLYNAVNPRMPCYILE